MGLSLKADTDFDFHRDKTNKFIPFIISFLMYSAVIAIMSCFFTKNLTTEWSNALNGHITLEFQANIDGIDGSLTEKQLSEIMDIVKSSSGIKSIKKLHETDVLKILEPWLNSTSIPDDFPFPTLFDVESDKNHPPDLLMLAEKLSKVCNGVKIHDHSNWYAPIVTVSNCLFFFAALLSILIFATVCVTVIFITKQTLSSHEDIVKILQLIGASNLYVASQFKRYYFSIGLKASIMSMILGTLTLAGIYVMSGVGFNHNAIVYAAILLFVPIIMTFILMITSKNSVMFFLNNEKWIG